MNTGKLIEEIKVEINEVSDYARRLLQKKQDDIARARAYAIGNSHGDYDRIDKERLDKKRQDLKKKMAFNKPEPRKRSNFKWTAVAGSGDSGAAKEVTRSGDKWG